MPLVFLIQLHNAFHERGELYVTMNLHVKHQIEKLSEEKWITNVIFPRYAADNFVPSPQRIVYLWNPK
jgi:hypothetical protein